VTTDGSQSSAPQPAQLDALLRENELLRAQRAQLLEALQAQKVEYTRTIDHLQHQLQYLLRRLFGRSAEKIDAQQLLLFEKLLDELAPKSLAPSAPASESVAPQPTPNGHGRRRLPTDLPRRKIIHDLPEDEKSCPCCGQLRHVIG
jgi:transposase